MTNNNLWLHHKPTGNSIKLGKRMGEGWYTKDTDLTASISIFFNKCQNQGEFETQDDFCLLMEDPSGAPDVKKPYSLDANWHPVPKPKKEA